MMTPPFRLAAFIGACLIASASASMHVPTLYHAPISLLTMLFSSPSTQLATTSKQSPRGGLTFDSCDAKTSCAPGRSCKATKNSFQPCKPGEECICLPEVPPLCFISSDCGTSEICADVPIIDTPLCVSAAATEKSDVIPITVSPGGGRTLDSCDKDGQCSDDRKCTFFGDEFRSCDSAKNCACLPPKPLFCIEDKDCPKGEVCALTSFNDRPFCVSLKSENAYIGVNKVPDADSCPVKIKRDKPSKSLDSPRETGTAPKIRKTRRMLMANAAARGSSAAGKAAGHLGDGVFMDPVERIVGGLFASRHLRRYMVAIVGPTTPLCTGTLLSPRWILTAAHCNVTTESTAVLGASRAFVGGTSFSVTRVLNHPKFDKTPEGRQFDIAVVEIEGAALKRSKFMEINDNPTLPKPDSFVRDIGFGSNSFDRKLPDENPNTLRQVDVPVTTFAKCSDAYKKIKQAISQKRQLCAGYMGGNCGSCQGDSGGPVIQYNKLQRPIIMGVVSFGVRCAVPGFPTVYTRVSAFLSWLKTTPAVFYTSNGVFGNEKCKPGEFLFSFTKDIKFCRQCASNQFSSGGTNAKCMPCPKGLSRRRTDGTTCDCAGGGKGVIGETCKECPRGQFSTAGSDVCKPCPPGSFAPNTGSSTCKECPAAFFAPKAGSTGCTKCPPGTTSRADGASKCA